MERKVEVIVQLRKVVRIDGVDHVVYDGTDIKDRSAEIEMQDGHNLFPKGNRDIVEYLGYHYLGQPYPESWGQTSPSKPTPHPDAILDDYGIWRLPLGD